MPHVHVHSLILSEGCLNSESPCPYAVGEQLSITFAWPSVVLSFLYALAGWWIGLSFAKILLQTPAVSGQTGSGTSTVLKAHRDARGLLFWGACVSIAVGIWTMHFAGILALQLGVRQLPAFDYFKLATHAGVGVGGGGQMMEDLGGLGAKRDLFSVSTKLGMEFDLFLIMASFCLALGLASVALVCTNKIRILTETGDVPGAEDSGLRFPSPTSAAASSFSQTAAAASEGQQLQERRGGSATSGARTQESSEGPSGSMYRLETRRLMWAAGLLVLCVVVLHYVAVGATKGAFRTITTVYTVASLALVVPCGVVAFAFALRYHLTRQDTWLVRLLAATLFALTTCCIHYVAILSHRYEYSEADPAGVQPWVSTGFSVAISVELLQIVAFAVQIILLVLLGLSESGILDAQMGVIRRQSRALQVMLQSQKVGFGKVTHELRTPLNGILNGVPLIREHLQSAAEGLCISSVPPGSAQQNPQGTPAGYDALACVGAAAEQVDAVESCARFMQLMTNNMLDVIRLRMALSSQEANAVDEGNHEEELPRIRIFRSWDNVADSLRMALAMNAASARVRRVRMNFVVCGALEVEEFIENAGVLLVAGDRRGGPPLLWSSNSSSAAAAAAESSDRGGSPTSPSSGGFRVPGDSSSSSSFSRPTGDTLEHAEAGEEGTETEGGSVWKLREVAEWMSPEVLQNVLFSIDTIRFLQMVNNGLSNAIKYTPEGGLVTLYVAGGILRTPGAERGFSTVLPEGLDVPAPAPAAAAPPLPTGQSQRETLPPLPSGQTLPFLLRSAREPVHRGEEEREVAAAVSAAGEHESERARLRTGKDKEATGGHERDGLTWGVGRAGGQPLSTRIARAGAAVRQSALNAFEYAKERLGGLSEGGGQSASGAASRGYAPVRTWEKKYTSENLNLNLEEEDDKEGDLEGGRGLSGVSRGLVRRSQQAGEDEQRERVGAGNDRKSNGVRRPLASSSSARGVGGPSAERGTCVSGRSSSSVSIKSSQAAQGGGRVPRSLTKGSLIGRGVKDREREATEKEGGRDDVDQKAVKDPGRDGDKEKQQPGEKEREREAAHILVVQVKDTGKGVPPERLGSLFCDFTHLSNEEAMAGSGLGLSLARDIARAMGGDCVLRSEGVDKGTSFLFWVPLDAAIPEACNFALDQAASVSGPLSEDGRSAVVFPRRLSDTPGNSTATPTTGPFFHSRTLQPGGGGPLHQSLPHQQSLWGGLLDAEGGSKVSNPQRASPALSQSGSDLLVSLRSPPTGLRTDAASGEKGNPAALRALQQNIKKKHTTPTHAASFGAPGLRGELWSVGATGPLGVPPFSQQQQQHSQPSDPVRLTSTSTTFVRRQLFQSARSDSQGQENLLGLSATQPQQGATRVPSTPSPPTSHGPVQLQRRPSGNRRRKLEKLVEEGERRGEGSVHAGGAEELDEDEEGEETAGESECRQTKEGENEHGNGSSSFQEHAPASKSLCKKEADLNPDTQRGQQSWRQSGSPGIPPVEEDENASLPLHLTTTESMSSSTGLGRSLSPKAEGERESTQSMSSCNLVTDVGQANSDDSILHRDRQAGGSSDDEQPQADSAPTQQQEQQQKQTILELPLVPAEEHSCADDPSLERDQSPSTIAPAVTKETADGRNPSDPSEVSRRSSSSSTNALAAPSSAHANDRHAPIPPESSFPPRVPDDAQQNAAAQSSSLSSSSSSSSNPVTGRTRDSSIFSPCPPKRSPVPFLGIRKEGGGTNTLQHYSSGRISSFSPPVPESQSPTAQSRGRCFPLPLSLQPSLRRDTSDDPSFGLGDVLKIFFSGKTLTANTLSSQSSGSASSSSAGPASSSSGAQRERGNASGPQKFRLKTFCLGADDDFVGRSMIGMLLERLGVPKHSLHLFDSGQGLINKLHEILADGDGEREKEKSGGRGEEGKDEEVVELRCFLIVSDLEMPDGSGEDVGRAIRDLSRGGGAAGDGGGKGKGTKFDVSTSWRVLASAQARRDIEERWGPQVCPMFDEIVEKPLSAKGMARTITSLHKKVMKRVASMSAGGTTT
uniref:histidine kinase n=1 Tax=Chromera velia CCMP2878 TaxID=1169474 RepID=A0A0G4I9T8_9ALVE|eukprot:Cvel_12372.t1-p1 / transcript=Cvel_12372.t1 / gene=Cvel_12372 / organism=Chromera_velia_CCMP2878 / gene_product=hypothetical protein / transcript_product=hypothetical protein / location=Cvel_scaffold807:48244-64223(-) / protein_length=2031 / sequence_SO=supercontig / SO=protein_coding / is_pseudo=false